MISVIIPAYNEEKQIGQTIRWITENWNNGLIAEIIVSDGGSLDETIREAKLPGVTVLTSPRKGRAAQMNHGASRASGQLLYFLHADTLPPRDFAQAIVNAWKGGYLAGSFMLEFDHRHWFLQANSWFTRFNMNAFRFGDQSLFVERSVFEKCGGFCEKHIVMEDQEIIGRIRKLCAFTIIRKKVITSTRKYLVNGVYKTQAIYFLIYFMYQLGFPQQKLVQTYRRLIRQDKI